MRSSPSIARAPLWALIWAALVLAVGVHQVRFWSGGHVDTDVLALLPGSEQSPGVDAAMRGMVDEAGREVVLLVGAPDWSDAQRAAEAAHAVLSGTPSLELADADGKALQQSLDALRPYRDRLLTPAQRAWLADATDQELGATALMKLHQPAGARLTDWAEDPLGLWPDWWAARAAESRVRPRDGRSWLSAEGREWVLHVYRSSASAFALGDAGAISSALSRARSAVQAAVPGAEVLAAGVPLYAEAAAAQASWEMSTIGLGSLVAVLALMWLTFRSLRPILLVGLSLVIGTAVATSVTALVFGRVHLLTLVFGATLVGVAEDYGFHYFAARTGQPAGAGGAVLRALLPGMALALLTSVVAYLALGLAPFPGLRQMAVFSAAGLLGAFLTVVCWFPFVDRGELPRTRFASRCAGTLERWPRAPDGWRGVLLAVAGLLFVGGGLSQLETRDDVRQLQGAPAALLSDQRRLGQLLGLPSPSQFFLVEGATSEETLTRELALKDRLEARVAAGALAGYRAISDWLPPAPQQAADAALSARGEQVALSAVAAAMGEAPSRPAFASGTLTVTQVLATPVGRTLRPQWLGELGGRAVSVVMLRGLDDPSLLASLAQDAAGLPGVTWVDRTAEISSLLGRYRHLMGALVAGGYLAVLGLLALRFGRGAWRAWMPSVLGTLITLAVLGWVGEPVQLFTVLGLLVLLGMGVDYGIFLLEHPGDGSAWLAVALAGVSTLLSFGLLALSATPALHAFGLTLLVGEVTIWVLTPFFRLPTEVT